MKDKSGKVDGKVKKKGGSLIGVKRKMEANFSK
jgi:hypothetical protein